MSNSYHQPSQDHNWSDQLESEDPFVAAAAGDKMCMSDEDIEEDPLLGAQLFQVKYILSDMYVCLFTQI